jgi:hypothetical protein
LSSTGRRPRILFACEVNGRRKTVRHLSLTL